MPRAYYSTDLSVTPPSRQMAATDVLLIPFESDTTATSATCALIDLASGELTAVQPTCSAVSSDITTVTVNGNTLGLAVGHAYELSVTFRDADEAWTGTLVLIVRSRGAATTTTPAP